MSTWCFLPLLGAILALLSITSTYLIIVVDDNVDAFLPYISRAGEYKLSRNIFGWGLSLYASSVFVVALLKWEVNQNAIGRHGTAPLRRANHAAAVLGCLAALFVTLLANFDMRDELDVHNVCAVSAFVFMTAYGIVSIILQRKLKLKSWFWPRLVLVVIGTLSFCALIVLFFIWPPESPRGWTGAIAEWSMCVSLIVYVGTFAADFRGIRLHVSMPTRRGGDAIMLEDRQQFDDIFQ